MKFIGYLGNKFVDPILGGIFFLSYATLGFIVFGDLGKYVLLCGGFLLLFFVALTSPFTYSFFNLVLVVSLYYFSLVILSVYNAHLISPINIIFGVVCLFLFYFGFLIAKGLYSNDFYPSNFIVFFISIFTIFGVIFLIRFQSQIVFQSGVNDRGYGEESGLNPVGIAYILGVVFIINFSILLKSFGLPKFLNRLLIMSLFFSVYGMITTLSRGALVYLGLILVLFSFFWVRSFPIRLRFFKNIFSFFVVILVSYFVLLYYFPFIEEKSIQISERFLGLSGVFGNSELDPSSVERLSFYEDFFKDIEKFVLLGQRNYSPYPHNQFFEILMRWGVFGIPFLVFSIVVFFKGVLLFRESVKQSNFIVFLIVSLFLFSYLQSMTSLSLEMNRFLWLGFGFVFGYRRIQR